MKPVKFTAGLAASACFALSANAVGAPEEPIGEIMRIEGSAMISQGTRYVDALEGMALRAQDRILVLEGGSALLQFTDGCQYSVRDSELLTIGVESACAEQAAKTAAAGQDGIAVETAAAAGQQSFEGVEQGATSQLGGGAVVGGGLLGGAGGGALIVGGLAAVGGIAAAADGTGSDDRNPNANRPPISQ